MTDLDDDLADAELPDEVIEEEEAALEPEPLWRVWVTRHGVSVLVLGVLVLATFVRFYRLDAQSFWHDEGNSVGLARRDIGLVLAGAAADIHPPGYYLALGAWVTVFGTQGEWPYRSFSAVCSVALVAVVYVLGARWFGRESGLYAALLTALNPFQVYYAQEARMYALLALLAALALWALWEWTRRAEAGPWGDWRAGLAVALVSVAGLYTHYTFPVILVVQSVGWLVWWVRQPGRPMRWLVAWGVAQALALVGYAPWMSIAYHQLSTWPVARSAVAWDVALAETARLLTFGPVREVEGLAIGLYGVCVLVAWWRPSGSRASRGPLALSALWVGGPVALMLGAGLYTDSFLKFLLVAAAPVALLAGHGLAQMRAIARHALSLPNGVVPSMLWSALGLLTLLGLVNQSDRALRALAFDPAYARDDYRGIAAQVRAYARADDAVLLVAPNQWEVFTFYFPDDGRVYPLARQRPLDAAAQVAELETIAATHRRLFVLYWAEGQADPEGVIAGWLAQNTYPARDDWYGNVRLAVYLSAPLGQVPMHMVDALWGGVSAEEASVRLRGYAVPDGALGPGDSVPITLLWEAEKGGLGRYKVYVHLVTVDGTLIAQHDAEPGDTTQWQVGTRVSDRHGLLVPLDAPPGPYGVRIGLYQGEGDARLPAWGADTVAQWAEVWPWDGR